MIVCVPPIRRRVLTDPPTSRRARRSRTVRAPPRGHRIRTNPWPPTVAAPGADRLCAAHQAPGSDRPSDEPSRPPEQNRPCAASWAPDPHEPVAPTVAAPGVDRLCAAHLAPGPAPRQDRPRAVQDPALASPDSPVTPPAPPAPRLLPAGRHRRRATSNLHHRHARFRPVLSSVLRPGAQAARPHRRRPPARCRSPPAAGPHTAPSSPPRAVVAVAPGPPSSAGAATPGKRPCPPSAALLTGCSACSRPSTPSRRAPRQS